MPKLVAGPFVLLVAVASLGATCGTPSPTSQTCQADGPRGVVTDVAVGTYDGATFTALRDGDVVPRIYGGQGAPMIVVTLRVTGADLGTCLPQSTSVFGGDGDLVASVELPLVIREVVPGTFLTGDVLLVTYDAAGGERVTIETTVGGVTRRVGVWVDHVGATLDAGIAPDA